MRQQNGPGAAGQRRVEVLPVGVFGARRRRPAEKNRVTARLDARLHRIFRETVAGGQRHRPVVRVFDLRAGVKNNAAARFQGEVAGRFAGGSAQIPRGVLVQGDVARGLQENLRKGFVLERRVHVQTERAGTAVVRHRPIGGHRAGQGSGSAQHNAGRIQQKLPAQRTRLRGGIHAGIQR